LGANISILHFNQSDQGSLVKDKSKTKEEIATQNPKKQNQQKAEKREDHRRLNKINRISMKHGRRFAFFDILSLFF
jgi:hypothetical protein